MKRNFKSNSELVRIFVASVCVLIAVVIGIVGVVEIVHKNNDKKQSSKPTETIVITKKNAVETATIEPSTKESTTTKIEIENIKESTSINQIESTNIETTKANKKEDIIETTKDVAEKTTKITEATTKKEEKETSGLVSLGEFKLTAYCGCSKCNGKWAGSPTASGAIPKANHTIAVDTSIIPFGTKVMINGNTYVAEDIGGAIKGNRIDIFMDSHSEAMDFGVQYAEVFVVNE